MLDGAVGGRFASGEDQPPPPPHALASKNTQQVTTLFIIIFSLPPTSQIEYKFFSLSAQRSSNIMCHNLRCRFEAISNHPVFLDNFVRLR